MNAVATIQTHMDKLVAFRNGEVVVNAHRLFLSQDTAPYKDIVSCCPYRDKALYFRGILREYVWYKRLIHRIRRNKDGGYTGYELKAVALRDSLEKLWPCAACIRRDNPTGRYKFEGVVLPRRENNG